ncbi:hypothetical protein [Luteolibacter marinus]|uniref:hypothetical protein n=1 Tax=Luteolibacter marinus TaxID=2776705 RepID=UPI0018677A3E|nr:hypothetical protein [Luteolibacter marinus]
MKPRLSRPCLLVAATCLPAVLSAAELAYESFDYSASADVTGESGGTGWSAGWTQDGESCVVRSEGLGYTDGNGNVLNTAGFSLDTTNVATTRSFRDVDGLKSDVWISFLYHLPGSNSKFEGVSFYRGATSVFGISNSSANTGPTMALNVGNGSITMSKGQFGVTHFVVLKVSSGTGSGGNDQVEAFIDPVLTGVPSFPDGVVSLADFDFDRVRIAGQDGSPLFVDELRIGPTYADVSPHAAAGGDDSDGDGLTDAQEAVLGLDPGVSDASLIAAIQAHPEYFGLFSDAGMLALGKGGVVLPKSGEGPVGFTFEVQHSGDLSAWPVLETYNRSVELPADRNYLRVTLLDR